MNEVRELFSAGTLPQWGMLLTLIVMLFRMQFGDAVKVRAELLSRVNQLRADYDELKRSCNAREDQLNERIVHLEEELRGAHAQRIQEQISLINAIIASVDAPELKMMLRTLESVQTTLRGNASSNVLRTQVEHVIRNGKDRLNDE